MFLEGELRVNEEDQSKIVDFTLEIEESLAFPPVKSSGECPIYLSSDMAGSSFLKDLGMKIATKGSVSTKVTSYYDDEGSSETRRLAAEETFDLSDFMTFEIQRGAEDSADSEDLAFVVTSAEIENNMLNFKLEFENPSKVSTGTRKDIMIVTIMDDSFFT